MEETFQGIIDAYRIGLNIDRLYLGLSEPDRVAFLRLAYDWLSNLESWPKQEREPDAEWKDFLNALEADLRNANLPLW